MLHLIDVPVAPPRPDEAKVLADKIADAERGLRELRGRQA